MIFEACKACKACKACSTCETNGNFFKLLSR